MPPRETREDTKKQGDGAQPSSSHHHKNKTNNNKTNNNKTNNNKTNNNKTNKTNNENDALTLLQSPGNVLLGRHRQQEILLSTFARVMKEEQSPSSEVILVHGTSGSGKTSLVDISMRIPALTAGAYLGFGKYDPPSASSLPPPFAGILEAFSNIVDQILQSPDVQMTRIKMMNSLGDDIDVLSALISNLPFLFGNSFVDDPPQSKSATGRRAKRSQQQQQQEQQEQQQSTTMTTTTKTTTTTTTTTTTIATTKTWSQAFSQFKSRCRNFVRALTDICPVVLFLDDVHWAEEESLDIIKFLITDPESKRLFFICSFRDDEIRTTKNCANTTFNKFLREFAPDHEGGHHDDHDHDGEPISPNQRHHRINHRAIPISSIRVENLTMEDTTQWLAIMMDVPPDDVRDLGVIAYQKTGGHPYTLVQYFELLRDHEYVRYSDRCRAWIYSAERIQSETKAESSSVLDSILLKRLHRIPPNALQILKIASCIGSHHHLLGYGLLRDLTRRLCWDGDSATDARANIPVTSSTEGHFLELLRIVISEGLFLLSNQTKRNHHHHHHYRPRPPRASNYKLRKKGDTSAASSDGPTSSDGTSSSWEEWQTGTLQFAHDRIQECVYKMVCEAGRAEAMHLQIGRFILKTSEKSNRSSMLLLIADQLYRGSGGMNDDEKMELVSILDEVGQDFMAKGAVAQSLAYLRRALLLLDPRASSWQTHYATTLELHQHLARSASLTGNFDEAREYIATAVQHSNCLEDRVGSHSVGICSRKVQGKLDEGLQLALYVLEEELEMRFPKHPQAPHVLWSTMGTTKLLERDFQKIRSLPEMTDARHLATMKFLHAATRLAIFQGWDPLISLLASRMVQFTLQNGRCQICPFGTWGMVVAMTGKTTAAYDLGRLALELVEDTETSDTKAFVLCQVHKFLLHWKQPVGASSGPLWDAYVSGVRSEHLLTAWSCGFDSTSAGFCAGGSLPELERKMSRICLDMAEFGQQTNLLVAIPTWQTIRCFMGRGCDNPAVLSGDAMEMEEAIQNGRATGNTVALSEIFVNATKLALFFHDWHRAEELLARLKKDNEAGLKTLSVHIYCAEYLFFDGVVALWKGKQAHMTKAIQTLKRWWKDGKSECSPFLALLLAEKWFLTKKKAMMKAGAVVTVAQHTRENMTTWLQPQQPPIASNEGGHVVQQAVSMFDTAIKAARTASFRHYEAFASERAGRNFLCVGETKIGLKYLLAAKNLYGKWGAMAKVAHVDELLEEAPS